MSTPRKAMEDALYALEYASDLTKPEDMSGCSCPICTAIVVLRGVLAEPEQEPMTEVADRFAHRMALELECVLSDGAYSNKWYVSAMQVLSEYRSAMNAIHEQHSPTFMGEPKASNGA